VNYRVTVRVTAPVQTTEVPERVAVAVAELFPAAEVEVGDEAVTATAHALEHFADRLREQRILDTARGVFFDGRTADGFAFELKKQAARHDVVNFAVGNPDELGDLRVTVVVEDPDVESLIDYLAPETDAEGRPVDDPAAE
jgi:predicted RNA binding protein with dsRBD fold (UPF0201 family)